MKIMYSVPIEGTVFAAVADLIPIDEDPAFKADYYLSRVNVPVAYRRLGYGTKLLKEVLADADKDNLILCVQPVSSGGLSQHQLENWYKKHGFVEAWQGIMYYPKLPYDSNIRGEY